MAKIVALLFHEALGHAAESDFIQACTCCSPFLNLPLLSPKITVIDYANTAFGNTTPIPIRIDDENTPTRDVCIINKGRRASTMTNQYTAAALGLPLTGNARTAALGCQPQVRMRNTALLPGPDSPEKIIASIQNGYYLVEPGNVYGDINGDFCCEIKEAYRIQGGKVREPISPCMVFGNLIDFMQSITMVGNDFEWFVDECTKWDKVLVGQGAPTIKAQLEMVDM